MSQKNSNLERIESYLNGRMTPAEMRDFEYELEDDRELARKFRLRQSFPSIFHAEGEDEITISITDSPEQNSGRKKGHPNIAYFVWAALLLVFAGLAMVFLFRTNNGNGKEVRVKDSPATDTSREMVIRQKPETRVQPEKTMAVPLPVELLSPADSLVVSRGEELIFRWKMQNDTFTNFYIISEAGHKLAWWRGIRPGISEYKVEARNFRPGRFYWYVGDKKVRRTLIIKE